jgi:hypothetical protein
MITYAETGLHYNYTIGDRFRGNYEKQKEVTITVIFYSPWNFQFIMVEQSIDLSDILSVFGISSRIRRALAISLKRSTGIT